MQSLLECALKSPRITRLIAQEAGRIRTLDFRSCRHLVDAPLLNVLGYVRPTLTAIMCICVAS